MPGPTTDPDCLPTRVHPRYDRKPVSAFSGKIPECVSKIFKNASSLIGKKSGAFLLHTQASSSGKVMTNLMLAMEKEGMHISNTKLTKYIRKK
ncbi:MAG: hypothetical protein U5R30_11125, partial [Deltaproteobacteria bacterium]|nr:hypothetical protein [Deltaproteobacteria bacterium]